MLRMLKPDPMPAADRDGQPYLETRPTGDGQPYLRGKERRGRPGRSALPRDAADRDGQPYLETRPTGTVSPT